jgi:hypothetical protein
MILYSLQSEVDCFLTRRRAITHAILSFVFSWPGTWMYKFSAECAKIRDGFEVAEAGRRAGRSIRSHLGSDAVSSRHYLANVLAGLWRSALNGPDSDVLYVCALFIGARAGSDRVGDLESFESNTTLSLVTLCNSIQRYRTQSRRVAHPHTRLGHLQGMRSRWDRR